MQGNAAEHADRGPECGVHKFGHAAVLLQKAGDGQPVARENERGAGRHAQQFFFVLEANHPAERADLNDVAEEAVDVGQRGEAE